MFSRPTVLGVGDFSREEFRDAHAVLARDAEFALAATLELALEYLQDFARVPELIVIAQPWPGCFSSLAVDRMRRAAPLARVWALLGNWSSGDSQSDCAWPDRLRTHWHEWPARWSQELARRSHGQTALWSLPVTATEEERLLATYSPLKRRGLIILIAKQPNRISGLADACHGLGFETLTWSGGPLQAPLPTQGAAAILWDTTPHEMQANDCVASLRAQFEGVPVIAVLDFPRAEDRRVAEAAGLAAVIAKPFLLSDLVCQLDTLRENAVSKRDA